MAKRKKDYHRPIICALLGLVIEVLLINNLPHPYDFMLATALLGILLWFVWQLKDYAPKNRFPISAKIFTTVSLLGYTYGPLLLPNRHWILLAIVWLAILVAASQVFYFSVCKRHLKAGVFTAQVMYLSALLMCSLGAYTYTGFLELRLLQVVLLPGIALGVLTAWGFTRKNSYKVNRGLCYLMCCMAAVVGLWFCAGHLNYALDRNPPITHEAVIEGKNTVSHRRVNSIMVQKHYRFQFTVDGETFYMSVPQYRYDEHEVGDTYNITRYQGAFGVPYYMSGRN